MDWERSYFDLCKEIEILKIRLNSLADEMKFMHRQMSNGPRTKLTASYSGMPGAGMDATPLDRQWATLQRVQDAIDNATDILALKLETKNRMESRMQEFEGLEYRVAFKRDIEGKSLKVIHMELNMSYDYIRELSAKIKRLQTA